MQLEQIKRHNPAQQPVQVDLKCSENGNQQSLLTRSVLHVAVLSSVSMVCWPPTQSTTK